MVEMVGGSADGIPKHGWLSAIAIYPDLTGDRIPEEFMAKW